MPALQEGNASPQPRRRAGNLPVAIIHMAFAPSARHQRPQRFDDAEVLKARLKAPAAPGGLGELDELVASSAVYRDENAALRALLGRLKTEASATIDGLAASVETASAERDGAVDAAASAERAAEAARLDRRRADALRRAVNDGVGEALAELSAPLKEPYEARAARVAELLLAAKRRGTPRVHKGMLMKQKANVMLWTRRFCWATDEGRGRGAGTLRSVRIRERRGRSRRRGSSSDGIAAAPRPRRGSSADGSRPRRGSFRDRAGASAGRSTTGSASSSAVASCWRTSRRCTACRRRRSPSSLS